MNEERQAIVITGAQGTGKSQKAIEMAEQRGSYKIASMADLLKKHGFERLLKYAPDTVIVEETTCTKEQHARLKVVINDPRSPQFIFVTNYPDSFIPDIKQSRRFKIIEM